MYICFGGWIVENCQHYKSEWFFSPWYYQWGAFLDLLMKKQRKKKSLGMQENMKEERIA